MHRHRLLLPTAFVLCVPPLADHPTFAPQPETSLTKAFTTRIELDLAALSVALDGEDPGIPELEGSLAASRAVEISDTYLALREGAPAKLRRTFETLDHELEFDIPGNFDDASRSEGSGSGFSNLLGQIVVFDWDDDEGEHGQDEEGLDGHRRSTPDPGPGRRRSLAPCPVQPAADTRIQDSAAP